MPTHRKSVMVVEDDEAICAVLKRYLEDCGYVCFSAAHANEGFEKIKILHKAGHPHMIISDVQMMHNGNNLLKKIETDSELSKIPFMFISAAQGLSQLSQKKILKKPFDLNQFLAEVEKQIGTGRDVEEQFKVEET